MRILCVIDSLGSGGAQRQLVELALGFQASGNEVAFLTYHPEDFYYPYLKDAGISVTCILSENYLSRFLKMRRFIRDGGFNAVISFLESSNFICEVSGFPIKKWNLIVGERSANPNVKKSFILKVYRWFHLAADYVVANSNANMLIVKSVNPFIKAEKCSVIPNLVNFSKWYPSTAYIPRRNGKLKMVVAASHQRLKNLNGLVDAIALLSPSERSVLEIDWYGDPINAPFIDSSLPEARQKIILYELGDMISFYPATNDLNQKIQQADVVGLFSFYEGLPNIICESMACAKPVICSAVSDIPSLLSYDKNLVFDPENSNSIKKCLNYIIGLSNQQLVTMGQLNRSIAKESFNKEIIIKKYLNLCS